MTCEARVTGAESCSSSQGRALLHGDICAGRTRPWVCDFHVKMQGSRAHNERERETEGVVYARLG